MVQLKHIQGGPVNSTELPLHGLVLHWELGPTFGVLGETCGSLGRAEEGARAALGGELGETRGGFGGAQGRCPRCAGRGNWGDLRQIGEGPRKVSAPRWEGNLGRLAAACGGPEEGVRAALGGEIGETCGSLGRALDWSSTLGALDSSSTLGAS